MERAEATRLHLLPLLGSFFGIRDGFLGLIGQAESWSSGLSCRHAMDEMTSGIGEGGLHYNKMPRMYMPMYVQIQALCSGRAS